MSTQIIKTKFENIRDSCKIHVRRMLFGGNLQGIIIIVMQCVLRLLMQLTHVS